MRRLSRTPLTQMQRWKIQNARHVPSPLGGTNIRSVPGGRRPDEGFERSGSFHFIETPHPNPLPQGERGQNRKHNSLPANRQGLTLLEVVLSLAIFVGAMAVLSELVSTGHRASLQSRMQTLAIIRAEAQMNEVIANPSLMVSASGMPFTEDYNPGAIGQWTWSLNAQSWDQNTNLLQLELTVQHLATDGTPNATYTLRRYVRDPQVLQEAVTAAEEAAAAEETTN